MRARLRSSGWILVGAVTVVAALPGCGGGAGSGPGSPSACGPGTHLDASQVCQIDPALGVVMSQAPTQNWFANHYANAAYTISLALTLTTSSTQNPAGTGVAIVAGQRANLTWSEGPDVASIQVTGGPFGLSRIANIAPTGGGATATSFTADVTDDSGTHQFAFQLMTGSLGAGSTPVATGQSFDVGAYVHEQTLLVDAGSLYWVSRDGAIRTVSLSGATVYTLATSVANGFAADAGNLYWAGSRSAPADSGLYTVPKAGGTVTAPMVATNQVTGATGFWHVATDGANVYFVVSTSAGNGIARATTAGASPTMLVSPAINPGVFQLSPLALDATHLYYLDAGRSLRAMLLSDGTTAPVATSVGSGGTMALDGGFIYWFDGSGVQKLPLAGGPSVQLVANVGLLQNLAVDGTNVYWDTGGVVAFVPVAPAVTLASPTMLATSVQPSGGLAQAGTRLYWTDSTGQVLSILK
jgi:hypothetical protein